MQSLERLSPAGSAGLEEHPVIAPPVEVTVFGVIADLFRKMNALEAYLNFGGISLTLMLMVAVELPAPFVALIAWFVAAATVVGVPVI